MRIQLQIRSDAAPWRAALAAALPRAAITVWPEVDATPDYALVWRPPAEFFARVRPRRAIFNLGAGTDALLAMRGLPADTPLIRIEDGGMAEQMAEYVTLAVLRAYREADAYALQQREALWTPRHRPDKAAFAVGILGFGVLGAAVARALAGFRFPLRAWSRTPKRVDGVESFAGPEGLVGFLSGTRVLVCMLRSTSPRDPSAGRARGQRRARRHRRRRGPPRARRLRSPRRCDARRVPRRAAAARAPVLASSADHGDAARFGFHAG